MRTSIANTVPTPWTNGSTADKWWKHTAPKVCNSFLGNKPVFKGSSITFLPLLGTQTALIHRNKENMETEGQLESSTLKSYN